MTYERLDREYELQWPCPKVDEPPIKILHTRLHTDDVGPKAKFVPVDFEAPIDQTDATHPFVLITGRRLAFYNTGVTTSNYDSKVKDQEEYLEISAEDAERLGIGNGTVVRVSSRRGSVLVPARLSNKMTAGNLFMAFHFPDKVDTNVLTSDAVDTKSGVAPFKYTAVKIEVIDEAIDLQLAAAKHIRENF
ncbi:molybdopterin oxidoreductase family protein [Fodinisporobacter ferrooxydans]|uniref:Molybdopterin oxidoreductase family protein n=2 Tax=Fodinisporobacter ferrooxydans TaxID=2901836 RepID=A0ABY4CRK2_9BACL|nr:molybdopterin oxidoreductase family protein [Alicyclobacillaceae bacterium MYW30-H2]